MSDLGDIGIRLHADGRKGINVFDGRGCHLLVIFVESPGVLQGNDRIENHKDGWDMQGGVLVDEIGFANNSDDFVFRIYYGNSVNVFLVKNF